MPLEKMHGVRSTDTSSAEDKPREAAAASTTAFAAVNARIFALLSALLVWACGGGAAAKHSRSLMGLGECVGWGSKCGV